jgi:hypothetical protein
MAEICVVHLVWAPLGPGSLKRFARSYRQHDARADHRLLIAFKQFEGAEQLAQTERLISDLDFEALHMPRRKLDLAAYIAIARQVDSPTLCFLNSDSELLDSGWLRKLAEHLRVPGVGLVGATGSYERLMEESGPLKFLTRPWFDPFPNPHVRTNAFMMRRETMLSLDWGEVRTKLGAWRLESGKHSITRQITAHGLEALVVGRDGKSYASDRWQESGTFRSGGQRNLLVADKRTRDFAQADPAEQRRLARLAWGKRPAKPVELLLPRPQ